MILITKLTAIVPPLVSTTLNQDGQLFKINNLRRVSRHDDIDLPARHPNHFAARLDKYSVRVKSFVNRKWVRI